MPVTVKDVQKRLKHGGKLHNCTAQTTRFELPFDLKRLEGLDAKDYLRQYAVVSNNRIVLYQRLFQKFRNPTTNLIESRELDKCIGDLLIEGNVPRDRLAQLRDLTGTADLEQLEPQLFYAFCAVVERLVAGKSAGACGGTQKGSTQKRLGDLEECRRQALESADFAGLQYKLRDVNLKEGLARLLAAL
ncbi:hypothetical protein BOX15_Mlig022496g2 [Macrostomum lignano]|uniref:Uncharacterized protein n=2 Tax=Macrostomum lignano TaxID=282301 RepID=A0A267F2F1_9PLAT|nr:hypothetical protein BOX15_Mlig022496g2 [Macrostomum lignano]